jgi:hypothetical protein
MLTAALDLAIASTASADGGQISVKTGSGWVHDSATPLFNVGRIAPGFSQTSTFEVRNDASDAGDLSLSASDIVEYENGCMHSEAVVDATCGSLQGELGHELVFSVYADPENDGIFEPTPRWTGSLYDLGTPIDLLDGLTGGGIAGLKIVMTLPFASGNETQTDDVDFSFRLILTEAGGADTSTGSAASGPSTGPGAGPIPQAPGSVEVKGIKATRHPPHPQTGVLHDITSQLPFTGTDTERMVAGGLWFLIAGTALTLLAATRRRRSAVEN